MKYAGRERSFGGRMEIKNFNASLNDEDIHYFHVGGVHHNSRLEM
jgi:hypothetical protein